MWRTPAQVSLALAILMLAGAGAMAQAPAPPDKPASTPAGGPVVVDPPGTEPIMAQLRLMFIIWDLDGDGKLDKWELARAFRSTDTAYDGTTRPKATPPEGQPKPPDSSKAGTPDASQPKAADPGKPQVADPTRAKPEYSRYADYQFLIQVSKDGEKISREDFDAWARSFAVLLKQQNDASAKVAPNDGQVKQADQQSQQVQPAQLLQPNLQPLEAQNRLAQQGIVVPQVSPVAPPLPVTPGVVPVTPLPPVAPPLPVTPGVVPVTPLPPVAPPLPVTPGVVPVTPLPPALPQVPVTPGVVPGGYPVTSVGPQGPLAPGVMPGYPQVQPPQERQMLEARIMQTREFLGKSSGKGSSSGQNKQRLEEQARRAQEEINKLQADTSRPPSQKNPASQGKRQTDDKQKRLADATAKYNQIMQQLANSGSQQQPDITPEQRQMLEQQLRSDEEALRAMGKGQKGTTGKQNTGKQKK